MRDPAGGESDECRPAACGALTGVMNPSEKKPNKWWTEPDTFAMLALIEQMGLVHELDKKRQRNESLFRRLRISLSKRGVSFTVTQIRNRWKSLKHKYRKIKTASYRSGPARLAAIEAFRYFHMLDHMLARRPKPGGEEEELTDDPAHLAHPDGLWPEGVVSQSEAELDGALTLEEAERSEPPRWGVAPDEVMTLGLSGEYLYAVKAEPVCSPNGLERLREAPPPSPAPSPAGTPEQILQQLSVLNQRLGEQLAEQRAFHCSMLGLMDRQIQVLEQLATPTAPPLCLIVSDAQTQTPPLHKLVPPSWKTQTRPCCADEALEACPGGVASGGAALQNGVCERRL